METVGRNAIARKIRMDYVDAAMITSAIVILFLIGFWRQTRTGAISQGEFVFRCAMLSLLGLECKLGQWTSDSSSGYARWGFEIVLVAIMSALAYSGYLQNERFKETERRSYLLNQLATAQGTGDVVGPPPSEYCSTSGSGHLWWAPETPKRSSPVASDREVDGDEGRQRRQRPQRRSLRRLQRLPTVRLHPARVAKRARSGNSVLSGSNGKNRAVRLMRLQEEGEEEEEEEKEEDARPGPGGGDGGSGGPVGPALPPVAVDDVPATREPSSFRHVVPAGLFGGQGSRPPRPHALGQIYKVTNVPGDDAPPIQEARAAGAGAGEAATAVGRRSPAAVPFAPSLVVVVDGSAAERETDVRSGGNRNGGGAPLAAGDRSSAPTGSSTTSTGQVRPPSQTRDGRVEEGVGGGKWAVSEKRRKMVDVSRSYDSSPVGACFQSCLGRYSETSGSPPEETTTTSTTRSSIGAPARRSAKLHRSRWPPRGGRVGERRGREGWRRDGLRGLEKLAFNVLAIVGLVGALAYVDRHRSAVKKHCVEVWRAAVDVAWPVLHRWARGAGQEFAHVVSQYYHAMDRKRMAELTSSFYNL